MDFKFDVLDHQADFIESDKKFVMMSGGVGSGKTTGNLMRTIKLMGQYPGIHIGYGGESIPFLRRTAMRDWRRTFPSNWFSENKRDNIYTLKPNGSAVQFVSCSDEEALRSFTNGAFCLEEMTNIKDEAIFNRIRANLRQRGMPNCFYGSTNPGPFSMWPYKFFIENPHEDSQVIYSTSLDNSFLPADYIKDLKRLEKTNPEYFRRMVMGIWGAMEGRIYDLPDEAGITELPEFLKRDGELLFDRVIAGVDFGWDHPFVISVIGLKGQTYYTIDEFYMRNIHIDQAIDACVGMMKKYMIQTFYCDPSRPEIISDMERAGLRVEKAVNAVYDGIMSMKTQIGSGNYKILRDRCPYHMREFDSYIWDKRAFAATGKETPISLVNDCMDANRYGIVSDIKYGAGFKFIPITATGASNEYKVERREARSNSMKAKIQRARIRQAQKRFYQTRKS